MSIFAAVSECLKRKPLLASILDDKCTNYFRDLKQKPKKRNAMNQETPPTDTIETPLTIDIRAHSYNPDVRSGKAPITVFDVLQWLYANTDSCITPNITADGSICLVTLPIRNGFLYKIIAQWDIRYPYLDQQPILLIKALAPYYQCTNFLKKMQLINNAAKK